MKKNTKLNSFNLIILSCLVIGLAVALLNISKINDDRSNAARKATIINKKSTIAPKKNIEKTIINPRAIPTKITKVKKTGSCCEGPSTGCPAGQTCKYDGVSGGVRCGSCVTQVKQNVTCCEGPSTGCPAGQFCSYTGSSGGVRCGVCSLNRY